MTEEEQLGVVELVRVIVSTLGGRTSDFVINVGTLFLVVGMNRTEHTTAPGEALDEIKACVLESLGSLNAFKKGRAVQ
jgi:hypothetical protein